jgi:hypothetical protein
MKRFLIIKPANDIFIENRNDLSKTDLQSNEIVAFVRILGSTLSKNKTDFEICLGCTIDTAVHNNTLDLAAKLKRTYKAYSVGIFDSANNEATFDHTEQDELIVFCGIWPNTELVSQQRHLIQSWKGRVTYIANDLRLMPEHTLQEKMHCITQAFDYDVLRKDTHFKSYTYMPLELLVTAFRSNSAYSGNMIYQTICKQFDIAYSYMNLDDVDDFRKEHVFKLFRNADIKSLIIGSKVHIDSTMSNQLYLAGLLKQNQVRPYLAQALASFIVSEQKYIDARLMPNRVIEALTAGTGLIVEEETYKSFVSNYSMFDDAKYIRVVKDASEITHNMCVDVHNAFVDSKQTIKTSLLNLATLLQKYLVQYFLK